MAQISPGDGAPGAAALQGIQDYADKLPGKSRTPHEPAPHTALARALNSLAKPPDCCARRAVEGDDGLSNGIPGAKVLWFGACFAYVCMLHGWKRDVASSCKAAHCMPLVAIAACKKVGRGWVMRENASPAPRVGLGLLCAPLCVA